MHHEVGLKPSNAAEDHEHTVLGSVEQVIRDLAWKLPVLGANTLPWKVYDLDTHDWVKRGCWMQILREVLNPRFSNLFLCTLGKILETQVTWEASWGSAFLFSQKCSQGLSLRETIVSCWPSLRLLHLTSMKLWTRCTLKSVSSFWILSRVQQLLRPGMESFSALTLQ